MKRISRLTVGVVVVLTITLAITAAVVAYQEQKAFSLIDPEPDFRTRAPIAISGDNAYIVWTTDKNMPNNNSEVMFRASTDSGATFGDKINLSNSSNIDSVDQEIAAEGENVFVTWWERNQTSNQPVMRVSNDNGQTFGPLLTLGSNGTIGSGEGE